MVSGENSISLLSQCTDLCSYRYVGKSCPCVGYEGITPAPDGIERNVIIIVVVVVVVARKAVRMGKKRSANKLLFKKSEGKR
jgi:hypothetical protein